MGGCLKSAYHIGTRIQSNFYR